LHFRHSDFEPGVSGLSIDSEYLRQRSGTRKNCNRFAPKFRLKANDGLHWKIWNE
jgi:hypothetical protein